MYTNPFIIKKIHTIRLVNLRNVPQAQKDWSRKSFCAEGEEIFAAGAKIFCFRKIIRRISHQPSYPQLQFNLFVLKY